jgi:hypothetical protein
MPAKSKKGTRSGARGEQKRKPPARDSTVPSSKLPPHLIDYQGARRCSICKMPFPPDLKPSVDKAFAEHVVKAHRPGQTSEEVNQAASQIVRGSDEA